MQILNILRRSEESRLGAALAVPLMTLVVWLGIWSLIEPVDIPATFECHKLLTSRVFWHLFVSVISALLLFYIWVASRRALGKKITPKIDIKIASPKENESPPDSFFVTGTVSEMPKGLHLWVCTKAENPNRYWPQECISPSTNGEWSAKVHKLGKNGKRSFVILLTNEDTNSLFLYYQRSGWEYFNQAGQQLGWKWQPLSDLPPSVQVLAERTLS